MSVPGEPTQSSTARQRALFGAREPMLDAMLRSSLLGSGYRPMQTSDDAARLLQLLTLIHKPRRALEIGTFVGYCAVHIARGLPPDGRLVSLERDPALAQLARRNLETAGVGERVRIVEGPAEEFLASVAGQSFDMIFIDGEKVAYPEYLKLCFPALAVGGLLIADDAHGDGDFSDEGGSAASSAIAAYNRAVARSPRLHSALVGTEYGLMISYKCQ